MSKTAPTHSNEIHLTRVYDAPVKAVWDAWTDADQVGQWWGPRGFTLTTHAKDLRPGGQWVYTMHGPDGTDYPNTTTYLEVQKYARLVYDHGASADKPPLFRVTVTFKETAGKTTMDMTMTLESPEAAVQTRAFIKQAGGNATWDRLAEYLTKQSTGTDTFVIARAFDAPLSSMWDMWTDPNHFSQWLPPTGFVMEFIRTPDVRPGQSGFYRMTNNAGITMYGRIRYLELTPPDRLVYTQQFCDEHENISRHPKLPIWPETMHTTVQLIAEGPDRTRVNITWQPHGPTTAEELAAFINMRPSMTQGWTGSLDKLEAYVSTH